MMMDLFAEGVLMLTFVTFLFGCAKDDGGFAQFGSSAPSTNPSDDGGHKKWCKLESTTTDDLVNQCEWNLYTRTCTMIYEDGTSFETVNTYNEYGYLKQTRYTQSNGVDRNEMYIYDCRDFYGTGVWCSMISFERRLSLEDATAELSWSCSLDGHTRTCTSDVSGAVQTEIVNDHGVIISSEYESTNTETGEHYASSQNITYNCNDRPNARVDLQCKSLQESFSSTRDYFRDINDTAVSTEIYQREVGCTWDDDNCACMDTVDNDGEISILRRSYEFNQFGYIKQSTIDDMTTTFAYTNCD